MKKIIAAPPLNADITRIEYKGQLVLTTAQLAEFYETTENSIKNNFRNNRERFIKEKHFFKLEGNELATFKNKVKDIYLDDPKTSVYVKNFDLDDPKTGVYVDNFDLDIPAHTKHLYLWTKRGCARHAKMLNTDMAWDVFEMLEDVYFDVYNNPENPYVSVTNFERADILCRLACHAPDPFTKKRLIDEATNLISKSRRHFT